MYVPSYKKNDMSKVMANPHFGPVTIVHKDFRITLPKNALTKEGLIKKRYRTYLNEQEAAHGKGGGGPVNRAESA